MAIVCTLILIDDAHTCIPRGTSWPSSGRLLIFFLESLFLAFTTEKRFGCRLHKYHHARNVHNGTGMRVRVNGPRFFLVKEADLEKGNPDTLVGLLSNCVCTMCLYWALLHTTVAAVESISFGSVPLQLPLCGSQGSQLKSKTPWM